jgi:hypothetical protein
VKDGVLEELIEDEKRWEDKFRLEEVDREATARP